MSDAEDPLPTLPMSKSGRNLGIGLAVLAVAAVVAFALHQLSRPKPRTPKVHREVAAACGPSLRTPDRERDPSLDGCRSDAECKKGLNGRCEREMIRHAHFENRCVYDGCAKDDDCKEEDKDPLSTRDSEGPCVCGSKGEPNACFSGNCRTDDDCGSQYCSPSRDFQCGYEGVPGYYCHTAEDECVDDADCADSGKRAECRYDPESERWKCTGSECHRY